MGQQVDAEAFQGKQPQHHHRQGQHDDADGSTDRQGRQATCSEALLHG